MAVENHSLIFASADLQSRRLYCASKRAFDVLVAGTLLFALLPLLAIIAFLVKLESEGPVLFRQRRVGLYGREFNVLKFRTMRACRRQGDRRGQADRRAAARDNGDRRQGDRRRSHKTRHDPRVTRLGRILRRTSLDELPQLWNVLRGDMSLVGPRPELPEIVAKYEPWQHTRHTVTPGLTGWWQVNRDGRRLMHEATELDLYYVYHQSWALDVRILFRTVRVVLLGTGAF